MVLAKIPNEWVLIGGLLTVKIYYRNYIKPFRTYQVELSGKQTRSERKPAEILLRQSAERKKYMILLFDYSADWAETEYPDTESLQLESGKPSVFRPVSAFKIGSVAVQFRVKSEISRIASMKIDHFRTFFRARFLPKMADLRHR